MNELLKSYKERDRRKFTVANLRTMYLIRLTSKIIRLFEYQNLPFPKHELEFRAIMSGFAGVVKDRKRGMMTAWGGRSGPTEYEDIFKDFTYAAATARGGTKKIGKDAVILKNTSMYESMYMWLYRYAELFAHNDISLRMALINSRYQDVVKVLNSAKKETVEGWYNGLYEGKLLAMIDDTPLSEFMEGEGDIRTLDLTTHREIDFTIFTELENELTRSFYRELGVRWNKDKKANLVAGEVEQDDMLLRFNIDDMLQCRLAFCEDYNRVFGGDIRVALRIPIESEVSENDSERVLTDDDQ